MFHRDRKVIPHDSSDEHLDLPRHFEEPKRMPMDVMPEPRAPQRRPSRNASVDDSVFGRVARKVSQTFMIAEEVEYYSWNVGEKNEGFPSNMIRTTKYRWYNFVAKNLWEQFRRVANFFFLMVAIFSLVGPSPLDPVTSILPLLFVLGLSMLKEGVEDMRRRTADKEANMAPYKKLEEDGELVTILSKDIEVGDIIYFERGQAVPADVVILSTSEDDGVAYMMTANLDGETNLKMRRAPGELVEYMDPEDFKSIASMMASVENEFPNNQFHSFSGRMHLVDPNVQKKKALVSLDINHLLLRGSALQNTHWAIGAVIFTGKNTKMGQNLEPPPSKRSHVEIIANPGVIAIFFFLCVMTALCSILSGVFEADHVDDAWYLEEDDDQTPVEVAGWHVMTYFILYSYMIPISLYVTVEFVRVGQMAYMMLDHKMAVDPYNLKETGMKVRNSNLNEELGMVEYVFSDKTGTLTENIMEFVQCSINRRLYTDLGDLDPKRNKEVDMFLLLLSVCHTIIPEADEDGGILYPAESPDELALVRFASASGYKLISSKTTGVTVEIHGSEQTFEILAILEFTPERKMMSIIVRNPKGKIILFSKGADTSILPRIRANDPSDKQTRQHLDQFSEQGFRTLCCAKRELSDGEFDEWLSTFRRASSAIEDRENKVAEAGHLIEKEMDLIGATAVEDKLQDQVPETIEYLLKAGIKVWMLTGDNVLTATNIGHSTRLLDHDMDVITFHMMDSKTVGETLLESIKKHTSGTMDKTPALVMDGHSLRYALEHHQDDFATFTNMCTSVVCCRLTPVQKAEIVRMVKTRYGKICLSIGDGANDVAMIQEANVGVGMMGREGTQAARSSDYSINEFKLLARLVCVHGRYSYVRLAKLLQYCFYKNMAFILPQFWFSLFNGFTAQTLYESWIMTFFNITWTSTPPMVLGIYERDCSEKIIEKCPSVFQERRSSGLLSMRTFTIHMIEGVWHSILIYWPIHLGYKHGLIYSDGTTAGNWTMGMMINCVAVLVVSIRIAIETWHWNKITHFFYEFSFVLYLICFGIYSVLNTLAPDMFGVFAAMWSNNLMPMVFVMIPVLCLLPEVARKYWQRQYHPERWQIYQEMEVILGQVPDEYNIGYQHSSSDDSSSSDGADDSASV